jgi:hypothetical protein
VNAEEKGRMLASLADGRRALEDVLQGVSGEAAGRKPAPDRWSILDCVEHLAIVEDFLLSQVLTATRSDVPLINAKREAAIPVRGLDRSRPIECPPAALPAGRFPALADALRSFLAARERTVRFVEDTRDDLRACITVHPVMGTVNCHEVLLSMAVHPLRHVQQIAEIKLSLPG